MHSSTPRYASYQARLRSFPPSSCRIRQNGSSLLLQRTVSPHPSPSELASAGFFHTGSADETVCPACGLGLRDWQASDQPEACHLAFSAAGVSIGSSRDCRYRATTPVLPCLYLSVHRLLASELPLARKSLVPAGPVQTVSTLPGVITPPIGTIMREESMNPSTGFASLADRLNAIVRIMSSPPAPQGWPIENARSLGHSDDLIVLALWRLQSESTGTGLACPPMKALRLDPQGTTDLLRAILRLQEGFDTPIGDLPEFFDLGSPSEDSALSGANSDADIAAEDAETAALSRCRYQRIRNNTTTAFTDDSSTSSPASVDSNGIPVKRILLPQLYQFTKWWSSRWPPVKIVG
ncbi:unnamed protein product [Dicrocoelium dendriticum]|nr:unnamed protein product [Dicrocoelium dendriticum]